MNSKWFQFRLNLDDIDVNSVIQNVTLEISYRNHFILSPFRHYSTNRAPLSLSFDPGWLQVNKGFTKVLKEWIREKLASQSDVYFVTQLQVIVLEHCVKSKEY